MINLARGFIERDYEVDIVLARAEGPYLAQVPSGVRVVDLKTSRVLASLPGLVHYLKREQPAAILSALDHANIVAIWAHKFARIKSRLVVSVHNNLSRATGNEVILRGRTIPHIVRLFYPWAHAVVAVSQGVAEDLARAQVCLWSTSG